MWFTLFLPLPSAFPTPTQSGWDAGRRHWSATGRGVELDYARDRPSGLPLNSSSVPLPHPPPHRPRLLAAALVLGSQAHFRWASLEHPVRRDELRAASYSSAAQSFIFGHTCCDHKTSQLMPEPCPTLGFSHSPAYLMSRWHRATAISPGTEVSPGRKLILREEAARQEQFGICERQIHHW